MKSFITRKSVLVFALGFIVFVSAIGGAVADRLFVIKPLDYFASRGSELGLVPSEIKHKILTEDSVVINVAETVSPSVVTVSIQAPRRRVIEFDPFGGLRSRIEGGTPQDIGTGFIVSSDGLIVTNKHVVSDTSSTYKVITSDGKEHEVEKISRDPSNDLAVLKINPSTGSGQDLKAVAWRFK